MSRKYYYRNREELSKRSLDYYYKNRDICIERIKKYNKIISERKRKRKEEKLLLRKLLKIEEAKLVIIKKRRKYKRPVLYSYVAHPYDESNPCWIPLNFYLL